MKKFTSSKSTKDKKGIVNDQFYTNPELARKLANLVQEQAWFCNVKRIIEPSAGMGAFSDLFDCDAYDIEPRKEGITKADFLQLSFEKLPITLAIGNPPFGRQGSLALRFVKKCCEFADYIAFILPKSFSKASVQNRVPLNFWLDVSEEIDGTNFYLYDGAPHAVPCVFQIWRYSTETRSKILDKKDSCYFEWTDKEHAEVAIRRVGFYAGTIATGNECIASCKESHYYIKRKDTPLNLICECFKKIDWSVFSSKVAGPRSLSRAEIVKLFEENYEKIL